MIGTVFIYALINLGGRLSGNKWLSLFVISGLLLTGFANYKSYMREFKADSVILLIGVSLVYIIDKLENDKNKIQIKYLLLIFVLAFVMDITKQQAVYIDAALGTYLLFTKKFKVGEKLKILGSLILAGVMALLVIFSIPNIEMQVIQNLKDMPYWSIRNIIKEMSGDILRHKLFFALLFVFALCLTANKIKLSSLAIKWLIISVFFGCAQIVGGWKIGGNAGNYEVGMVAFLPFAVMAADYLFKNYLVESKRENIVVFCNIVLILSSLFTYVYVCYSRIPVIIKKVQTDYEVSEYLSDKFGEETIMYYSNQYMQLARSTVVPGMDIYTVPSNIEEYWDTRAEHIKSQTYKYLYVQKSDFEMWDAVNMTYFEHESNAVELLDEYYTVIEDPAMPECLQGQLYAAKER